MKKFIKENWFKLSIIILILIVGLSVVCCLLVFMSQKGEIQQASVQNQESSVFDAQNYSQISNNQSTEEECSRQAQIILENVKQSTDNSTTVSIQNHYNKQLDKCIVDVIGSSEGFLDYSIYDGYEQKILLECFSVSAAGSHCFIPTISSGTGQVVNMTYNQGMSQIQDYMNN